jgi:hypothetical protein
MAAWLGSVVSLEKSPRRASSPAASGNADYDWAGFDPEAYFRQYYGDPHPDDERVIQFATAAMKHAAPVDAELDVVDVGTGPNLIPLFCALPRARSLTAWEHTETNIAWLRAELMRDTLRPQWRHFWNVTRRAYQPEFHLPEDPIPDLRAKCTLRQGSIFELPERAWDAATMFFCAESITGRQNEFEAACTAFARSVRAGGALLAAFLVRSKGYVVGDTPFPGVNLSVEAIENVFGRHVRQMKTEQTSIVDREIRSGYFGLVFLTGVAR